MARALTHGLAAALALAIAGAASPARASDVAEELVREARAHEAAHEVDLALRRYSDALAVDPTHEGAYLGLGALRFRLGDAREAERVYDTALSHIPTLATAHVGRARVRRALGALREADDDLELYVSTAPDPAIMRELADWYAEEGRPLAQLAVWRRLLGVLEQSRGDSHELHDARTTVHALELIVGPADPVREPPGPTASPVRRGIARMDRRR